MKGVLCYFTVKKMGLPYDERHFLLAVKVFILKKTRNYLYIKELFVQEKINSQYMSTLAGIVVSAFLCFFFCGLLFFVWLECFLWLFF